MSLPTFLALVAAALLYEYGSTPHGDPDLFVAGFGIFLVALGLATGRHFVSRNTRQEATIPLDAHGQSRPDFEGSTLDHR